MRRQILVGATALVATAASAAPALAADATTYTLNCNGTAYTVVKGNESAASYTDGTMNFITAIGSIKTNGTAQPGAVLCTINGFGPIPFVITPAR
jgi:hypothetical protein